MKASADQKVLKILGQMVTDLHSEHKPSNPQAASSSYGSASSAAAAQATVTPASRANTPVATAATVAPNFVNFSNLRPVPPAASVPPAAGRQISPYSTLWNNPVQNMPAQQVAASASITPALTYNPFLQQLQSVFASAEYQRMLMLQQAGQQNVHPSASGVPAPTMPRK